MADFCPGEAEGLGSAKFGGIWRWQCFKIDLGVAGRWLRGWRAPSPV